MSYFVMGIGLIILAAFLSYDWKSKFMKAIINFVTMDIIGE